ncbi:MAG: Ig-like domain-containing protein [Bacteroidales bacterium]|nr:Ig-like domain-containing protein [Bacteroidales bacterium]
MKVSKKSSLHWLLIAILAMGLAACASVGRPQGGPKDTEPPVFVSSNPAPEAKNVDKQKIDIIFNENIQLQDAFNKVIVSPVQKTNPSVSSNGRHVTVELKDSLIPNMTYTIDFGDAIKDLNEGNILDGFTTAFSTGDSIDTLRISGMVVEARTLEPAQSILVGIYSNLSDTAVRTLPFERVARTNQLGQFTIHNLKPGEYRIYALNDLNRDYKWDRSEDVAFYDVTVSPWTEPITVTDTLRSWLNQDSLVQRAGTAYFPNDLLLCWFNEGYQAQYLKDYARPERRRITLQMAAPSDSLPEITIAKGPLEGANAIDWALLHPNPTRDSLEYWIRDTTVLAMDSLYLSVKYLRTDTADQLTWKADTLKFFWKEPKVKEEKKKKKKEDEENDTLPPPVPQPTFMQFSAVTGTNQELNLPLIFKASKPIDTLIDEGVHLAIREDTLWIPVPDVYFEIDSLQPLTHRRMYVNWAEGEKYKLTVDSAAITNIYGEWNNTVNHEFTVKKAEEYANLLFNVIGLDTIPAMVELLDKSDKVIAIAPVVEGQAYFPFQKPGTVYARLFLDANDNGVWDTGLLDSIQPEEVYYYPKKINLKKNWDIAQDWNIYEVAIDLQKPYDIKKNKPKLKDGEKRPTDDEEEEDEYGGYGYGGYGTTNSNNYLNTGGFKTNY